MGTSECEPSRALDQSTEGWSGMIQVHRKFDFLYYFSQFVAKIYQLGSYEMVFRLIWVAICGNLWRFWCMHNQLGMGSHSRGHAASFISFASCLVLASQVLVALFRKLWVASLVFWILEGYICWLQSDSMGCSVDTFNS